MTKARIIEIENCAYNESIISGIAESVGEGKIIIMPSDTIYGFLAVESQMIRLRKLKRRDEKPFLYLINNIDMLACLGVDKTSYLTYTDKYWPGPVTFIMKNNKGNNIGIRMTNWFIMNRIIAMVNQPLLSTSVNLNGRSHIDDSEEIIKKFGNKVDLIIIDKNFEPGNPSTIVDISEKTVKILRQGGTIIDEA